MTCLRFKPVVALVVAGSMFVSSTAAVAATAHASAPQQVDPWAALSILSAGAPAAALCGAAAATAAQAGAEALRAGALGRFQQLSPGGGNGAHLAQSRAYTLSGGERRCVDLDLEVALVLVPIPDLDRERQEEGDPVPGRRTGPAGGGAGVRAPGRRPGLARCRAAA